MADPQPPQRPQPPQPDPPRRGLRPIVSPALTCVLAALAGVPGGLIWAAIAPRAHVVVTGRGAATVANPETSAFIAADGWFCVAGLAGGLLCGSAYLLAVRKRGALTAAALIIGCCGASLLAWWIGHILGLSGYHTDLMTSHPGAVLAAPLTVRAHSALGSWPFGAALAVVVVEMKAGWGHRDPRFAGDAGTRWAEAGSR